MKKLLLFLLLLVIIGGIGAYYLLPDYLSTAKNESPIEIKVPQGASLNTVAEDLYVEGVISSRLWFRYKGQEIARNIRPGTYTFPPSIKIEQMYKILQQGEQEKPIIITFPEGFILSQFANKVEESGLGSAEDFIKATNEYFEKQGYGFDTTSLYYNMEGYLFPDTYHFTEKQTVNDVVSRLSKTMESVFSDEYKNRAEELGLSIHEVLTLASLIEREAYNDEERATISGVIHNRLKKGMILQIDATVIYGLGEGKEHKTRVLYEDLEKNNPFNTYKNIGLPPGPIASPGKNSIYAALYPENHDYIYYVMSEKGHVFSVTYQEHLKNVANYRKIN